MVGVGIIGCGSIAKFRHAPEVLMSKDAKLIGFFDPSNERADAFVKEFGGRTFSSAEEMCKSKAIDAIVICSVNAKHFDQTMLALSSGKHVLCEKPMAISVAEAIHMNSLAEKVGKKLMIAENFRLAPAHKKAKELLDAGAIGKVETFRAVFGHRGPEYWSADKSNATWFFSKDKCQLGSIGDVGIHKIDAMRWLLGSEVVEISAQVATLEKKDENGDFIDVDDNTIALLKFENGVFGSLFSSWTIKGDEDHSTVLYGSKATMRIYDDPNHAITIVDEDKERSFYDVGAIPTNEDGGQFKTGIIDEFILAIKKDTEPLISGKEGIEDLRIVENIIKASKEKIVVKNEFGKY